MTDRRHTPSPLLSLWRKVWGGETSHRTSTGDKPITEEASTKSAADGSTINYREQMPGELRRMRSTMYWAVRDCHEAWGRAGRDRDYEELMRPVDEKIQFIYDLGRAKGREERGEKFAGLLNTTFANLLPTGFTVNFEQQAEVLPTENANFSISDVLLEEEDNS